MPKDNERGIIRKAIDKVGFAGSFLTLPAWLIGGVSAVAAGAALPAVGAFTMAKLDHTQIKEHGRPPEKQSWYNPERIMDRIVGSLRFGQPKSKSMIAATAPR